MKRTMENDRYLILKNVVVIVLIYAPMTMCPCVRQSITPRGCTRRPARGLRPRPRRPPAS